MMPVSEGRMKPPKKSKSQSREPTTAKEEKKGMGRAQATAHSPMARINLKDFFVL